MPSCGIFYDDDEEGEIIVEVNTGGRGWVNTDDKTNKNDKTKSKFVKKQHWNLFLV